VGRRDTILVVALVAILIALAALAGAQGGEGGDEGDPRASTYIRSPGGLAALYWTFQELRMPVARRTDPLIDADSIRGTLAIVGALETPTGAEMGEVAEHLRRGGTLLFVSAAYDFGGAPYDTLGLRPVWLDGVSPWEEEGGRTAVTTRPHRWTQGVRSVQGFRRAFSDTSAVLRRPGTETLLAVDGKPVAITFPVGEGRVIAISDPRPLTNARLRRSGAALLVVRAVAEAGDTLFFDEYHQGFSGEGSLRGGTLSMIRRFVTGAVAVQLLVVVALLMWAGARRFGAPLLPPPARRRSPLEHVEALAGAYRQAGARRTVRRLLMAGMARRLGRRTPPDERAAAEMLERMARQSPVGGEAAAEVVREFKRGESGDLVALTRGVDRLLDEVRR
jgi:hypothetical protein